MAMDCLVIGGGVIGLTTAWRLAQLGFSVRVCDQSQLGKEASWAGAGILPPGYPGSPDDPLTHLTDVTCGLWQDMSAELHDITGVDNQFQRCGGVEFSVGTRADLLAVRSHWEAIGARTEWLESQAIREIEPAYASHEAAFLLPDLCQVRNPRHLQALLRACELAGVQISPACPILGWKSNHGRLTAAVTPSGEIAAGQFCVTAGAWSSQLLTSAGVTIEIVPVRGQIVLLESSSIHFKRVLERGKRYLVPRCDGRILLGSTEEFAGFEKKNTAEGVSGLIEFAAEICPALKSARIEQCWSGLRPSAVRGRPFIGRVPEWENLLVAAGHFRSGLHLSPATAQILVSLAQGENARPEWAAFCP